MEVIFVNREKELRDLSSFYESCKKGGCCGVLLYGFRRIGKSLLAEKFIEGRLGIKLNCAWISDPESFVMALRDEIVKLDLKDVDALLLKTVYEERNPMLLLKKAFDALSKIEEYCEEKPIIVLDEFHIFLDKVSTRIAREMKKPKEVVVNDLLWLLKDLVERKKAFWIFLSSIGWKKLQEITHGKKVESPLLGVLIKYEVKPMEKDGIAELARARNLEISDEEIDEIYQISGGIPAIADIIASYKRREETVLEVALRLLYSGAFDDFFENLVKFVAEVIKRDYAIVLRILKCFEKDEESPEEIASKAFIDRVSAYIVLEELYKVGLLEKMKRGRSVTYKIKYPLLKTWLELRVEPRKNVLDILTSRLGITAESYVRELLRAYEGEELVLWDDEKGTFLAGTAKELRFKVLKVWKKNELNALGVEMDAGAECEGEDGDLFLCIEVKAISRDLSSEDVNKLVEKVELLTKKLKKKVLGVIFLLGLGGVTLGAVREAISKGIIIVTQEGVKMLAKKAGMPFF